MLAWPLLEYNSRNTLIQTLAAALGVMDANPVGEEQAQAEGDDSLESSSSDDEEEVDNIDERNVASREVYKFMHQVIDKHTTSLLFAASKFQKFKTKISMENIDRECKPMPIHLLVNRFDRIELLFKRMQSHLGSIKRDVKTMERHDTQLFYPENFRHFQTFTYPRLVKSAKVLPIPEWTNQSQCVCCSQPANVSFQRNCIWCQGHHCECRQYIMCENCSIRWYWDKSECFTRSYSTCPHCRAEYCLEDIIVNRFQPDTEDVAEQIEFLKRKLATLESSLLSHQDTEDTQASKRVKFDDSQHIESID